MDYRGTGEQGKELVSQTRPTWLWQLWKWVRLVRLGRNMGTRRQRERDKRDRNSGAGTLLSVVTLCKQ